MKNIDRLLGIFGRGFTLFCSIFIVSVIGVYALSRQEGQLPALATPLNIILTALSLAALLTSMAYFSIPLTAGINWLISKGHLWPLHATPWVAFATSVAFVAWFFSEVMYPSGFPPLKVILFNFTIASVVILACLFCLGSSLLTKINSKEAEAMHQWMLGLEPRKFR